VANAFEQVERGMDCARLSGRGICLVSIGKIKFNAKENKVSFCFFSKFSLFATISITVNTSFAGAEKCKIVKFFFELKISPLHRFSFSLT
jgi:hypothetical protein